ncbi:hypothetical protein NKDENANG_04163 [Candidatus Entotheonellaceae bacterium PAL068K]
MKTNKIESFPIVAMGDAFWGSLRPFVQETLVAAGTISPADLNLIHLTDSLDEAITIVRKEPINKRIRCRMFYPV